MDELRRGSYSTSTRHDGQNSLRRRDYCISHGLKSMKLVVLVNALNCDSSKFKTATVELEKQPEDGLYIYILWLLL